LVYVASTLSELAL